MRFRLLPRCLLIISLLGPRVTTATSTSPNFLFIAVDDLNHYASFLSDQPDNFLQKVYPDPSVREAVVRRLSPNLQRLAQQSLIFRRAYSASPLCGPSRTALLTGVPPHRSGYYQHDRHFRLYDSLADVVTLPQYLRQQGYFTTGVGKVFHKQSVMSVDGVRNDWPDLDYSWDQWVERVIGVSGPANAPAVYSPYSPQEGYFRWGVGHTPLRESWDYLNADYAAKLLESGHASVTDIHGIKRIVTLPDDKPFFMAVGIFAPHMPWFVPEEFLELFPTEEMTGIDQSLISLMNHDAEDLTSPVAQKFLGNDFDTIVANGAAVDGPGTASTINAWRSALQAYLATYAFADRCVGRIVNAVETNPARDNTVVMLWGDHGWHLGEKRRFRKHALWDGANHTVLLMRDPAHPMATQGRSTEHLVTLQDLYPTVVARAGLPLPHHVHGRDLSPLLAEPDNTTWPDEILTTFEEGNHAIRTPKYHYIRYLDGTAELYDLAVDPLQIENVRDLARYQSIRAHLDSRLNALLAL